MRFYRHIDIYKVEFMLNKYLKRWVQFVDTVIWVTNTTEYTELIGSEVASKWFSHSWMIARTLPKQAHPGRRSPRARFAGTGGFAARGGGHTNPVPLPLLPYAPTPSSPFPPSSLPGPSEPFKYYSLSTRSVSVPSPPPTLVLSFTVPIVPLPSVIRPPDQCRPRTPYNICILHSPCPQLTPLPPST